MKTTMNGKLFQRQIQACIFHFTKSKEKLTQLPSIKSWLTILTGKDWCFTQFSTGMAGWLLLIFFICLHNQLSSIHFIISRFV